jgi:ParB family chromosome partitioning protein
MAPPTPKNRLGKGMNVLFGHGPVSASTPVSRPARDPKNAILKIAIEDIEPNHNQPRKHFPDQALRELANSIAEHGLMQPLVTRKNGDSYQIIAGERRWRASQLAGLKTVDVIIKDVADDDVFVLALIENIQREDLNPIEEAEAYRQIIDQKNLTQEQLAQAVGKERSSIANVLRLLKLPKRIRSMVAEGALGMGHARSLLSLSKEDDMVKAAQEFVKRGFSARQAEAYVRQKVKPAGEAENFDPYAAVPGGAAAIKRETEALVRSLGTKVRLAVKGRRGKIEIDFSSFDELDRLIEHLKR